MSDEGKVEAVKPAKLKRAAAANPAKGERTRKKATEEQVPSVTITLNKAAIDLFGNVDSVRIRIAAVGIEVRPTNRTKGLANFPKGEILSPLKRTSSGVKFDMPETDVAATKYVVSTAKYGWLLLHDAGEENLSPKTPTARVSR